MLSDYCFSPSCIPRRHLGHLTECQLGICQETGEEHNGKGKQVFLAHRDMVESWLMDLLKFMNLKNLEAFYEGEEIASSLDRAWHIEGAVQISLINDVRWGSLSAKAAQTEGVFMLCRH